MGVVRSMALYGAPVWADTLNSRTVALLRRPQRAMAIRVIRGYRTISHEAACVLASSLPWDLDARSLASVYRWREEAQRRGSVPAPREVQGRKDRLHKRAVREWKSRLAEPSAGARTVEAVRPILKRWLGRQHGVLTFRVTQVLSGHGCFGRYLCRIGREPTARCHHCDGCLDETAQHVLEECPAWAGERSELSRVVPDLSLPAVVRAMVGGEEAWSVVVSFCEAVMLQKETAEREREASSELPLRQRRTGRRRAAYARGLPP